MIIAFKPCFANYPPNYLLRSSSMMATKVEFLLIEISPVFWAKMQSAIIFLVETVQRTKSINMANNTKVNLTK